METYKISQVDFIRVFREKNISLFNTQDLKKIFNIKNDNTLKHLIRRLKISSIIKKLTKGKYLFLHSSEKVSDFAIANFLKTPSYISLESALSYYSLIDQFPYRIFSLVLDRPTKIKVDDKIFNYSKVKKEYFKDYVKIDQFVIASKEKAIFDYLYFIYKGLKPKNLIDDLKPFINEKKTISYLKMNVKGRFIDFLKPYVKL